MTLTAQDLVANAKQQIKEIDTVTAQSQLGSSLILDVRDGRIFRGLPGAINILGVLA